MAVGRAPADLDLGSLGAFLDAGGSHGNAAAAARFSQLPQRHGKGTSGASNAPVPGLGLPMRPQPNPFQDSAGLNRKVAFKMLKQLGCQVRAVEPEDDEHGGAGSVEAFIEVRQHTQPVLFQMLLEFGYHPFLTVDSATAIRVEQPRQRAREQVFAALAAPRPPKLPEQLPADVVKLKMSMQDEQDSVRRLSERRATKAEEVAAAAPRDKEPKKYRSAAEQKIALDRLVRPRDAREADSCDSILLPPPASASTSCLSRGITWPRPVIRPRASSTGAEPRTVRPSPRLAQVGTFALRTPGSSSGHSPADYSDTNTPALDRKTVAPPLPLAMLCSSLEALGLVETACDTQPVLAAEAFAPLAATAGAAPASDAATIEVLEAGVPAPTALECGPPEHSGTIGTASLAVEPESLIDSLQSLSHIDSVLGPLAWPGRASATRSQAEQQDRAKRLARPRVPQTPQDTQPTSALAPKRSSLAQRDACSRLAVPRAPAVQKAEPSCGSDALAETQVGVDESGPQQEGSTSMEPQEVGQARVVVIPSMLSQLGLGRIDEHAPAAGSGLVKSTGQEGRRRQRASSVPPAAAPYAAPVVPGLKAGSGDNSSSSRSGDSSSSSSGPGSRRHPRSRSAHQSREAHSEKASSSLEQLLNDPRLVAEVVQDEIDENGEEGGEAMLAHIDRLYNSLWQQQALVSAASRNSDGGDAAGNSQGSAVFRMLETKACHGADSTRASASCSAATTQAAADEVDEIPRARCQDANGKRDVKRASRATGRSAMALLEDARNQAVGQDSNEAQTPTRAHDEDDDDGEGLIANIDQLYNDLMQGDSQNETPAVEQMSETAASAATEEPAIALPLPTAGGPESQELLGLLEEVLWSALLLRRGSGGGLDVQANLLELLPPHELAQCFVACGSDSLASSLLQRLSVELPGIHTALVCMSPRLSGSCMQSRALLAANVRKARDQLLILASTSSACTTPSSSVPPLAPSTESCTRAALSKERAALEALESARSNSTEPGRRRPKPRKSSMSHWTADSLDAMEAPPRRCSQRMAK